MTFSGIYYYDKFVHLQLLEYMVKIWRLHIKQHKEPPDYLPIVIPLLVCHAGKEWPENTERLSSLLSGPAGALAVTWGRTELTS